MGADKKIIVAVELGSTFIRAIAGSREPDGTMTILASAQTDAAYAIRRGIVDNLEKTSTAIRKVVNAIDSKLQNDLKLKVKTKRIYVGFSGQSLHSVQNKVVLPLTEKSIITDEIMDSLEETNKSVIYPDFAIQESIRQESIINGNRRVDKPVGLLTNCIETQFVNIISRQDLVEIIEKVIRDANLELAELLISPLCLAKHLLSADEKRSGCALVDIGASTTTVSVYTENILRSLAVIPIGGANVTNDIKNECKVMPEEAEVIKIKYATALVDLEAEPQTPQTYTTKFGHSVTDTEVQNISEARYEEILRNAWERIRPYEGNLLSGIVFTGGASRVNRLLEGFSEYTKYNKLMRTVHSVLQEIKYSPEVHGNMADNLQTVVSLLLEGNENCVAPLPTETATQADLFDEHTGKSNADPSKVADASKRKSDKGDEEPAGESTKKTAKRKGPSLSKRISKWWDKLADTLSDEQDI